MNFRNKDLKEIFDERYQANHNKELQENAKNNKKNMADRMFGKNILNNNNNNIANKQNSAIGYTPNNQWKV